MERAARAGIAAIQLHGRTRAQRYNRRADWNSIKQVAQVAKEKHQLPLIANGDVYSFLDYEELINSNSAVQSVMIGRGALQKPWLFTEIKERRHWDISSHERFELIKRFTNYLLEYFGSDTRGVETSRRFLLEFLSFLCRYVPHGLLEQTIHPSLQLKPQKFVGRDDLETLMASRFSEDWVKLSELVLGPAPEGYKFIPKHKSNAYSDKGDGGKEEDDDVQG
jgi:tRNA-dihydrouridine synthase 3